MINHITLAAIVLFADLIVAALIFLVMRRQRSPMTFILPPIIAIAGIISAIVVFIVLKPE